MLERTTKTETGKELKMWLEGKEMMASLEGLVENRKMAITEWSGYEVISLGAKVAKCAPL